MKVKNTTTGVVGLRAGVTTYNILPGQIQAGISDLYEDEVRTQCKALGIKLFGLDEIEKDVEDVASQLDTDRGGSF